MATLALLLVPLVALQFTYEVNWGIEDIVAEGGLLFAAGMAYNLIKRRARSALQRLAVGVLVRVALGAVRAQLPRRVLLPVPARSMPRPQPVPACDTA